MPKYIFHVGPPKTASTFIQSHLFYNREYLAQNGVLYPDFWLTYVTHHPLTNALRDGVDLKDGFDKLNSCEFDTVLFSSETFDELKTSGTGETETIYWRQLGGDRLLCSSLV